MYGLGEMQKEWYSQRIGAVYGDYEVIKVEYDSQERKQKWTMRCTKCGDIRVTYNHHDYVKGRNSGRCKVCNPSKRSKMMALSQSLAEKKEMEYQEHIGETYGSWEVIDAKVGMGLKVRCTICGTERWRGLTTVLNHVSNRCACASGKRKFNEEEWLGKRFGHLTVIGHERVEGRLRLVCKCDCGNEITASMYHLKNGDHITCGRECPYYMEDVKTVNGDSSSRLYRIWYGMNERCSNERHHSYYLYGGRGIQVCKEWRENFFNFKKWALENGYRDDLTIDRIDGDKGYEPSNCRWATLQEQGQNKRPPYTFKGREDSMLTFIDGEGKTKTEWCEEYHTSLSAVYYRMKTFNLPFEKALVMPRAKRGRPRKYEENTQEQLKFSLNDDTISAESIID